MVNKLIDIVGQEIKLLESYLKLLGRKQSVQDESELRLIKADQLEILTQSNLLNSQRSQLIERIKEINRYDENPNLSRLVEIFVEESCDHLEEIKTTFDNLDHELEKTRTTSLRQLERSRKCILDTLKKLSSIYCPESFDYENSGLTIKDEQLTAATAVNTES